MSLFRQQKKLEKQFVKVWGRSAVPVLRAEGLAGPETLLPQMIEQFRVVSADLPDLKATPASLRPALVGSLNMIVLYKVLNVHGVPAGDIGRICTDIVEKEVNRIPAFIVKLANWFMFSNLALRQAKKEAKRLKKAPENQFRMTIDGEPGRLEMNITQCAICHLTARHGAAAFTPYICKVDKLLSDRLRWGLRRTQTIASGAKHCDFVFIKGAETHLEM